MYLGMIETMSSQKSYWRVFHENYSDLFKKNNMVQ